MNKNAIDPGRGTRAARPNRTAKNVDSKVGSASPFRAILTQKLAPAPLRLEDHHNSEVRLVSFEYFNPTAREVFVAGSFNDWNPKATPMTGHRGGKWSTELLLKPGRYEYRFVVDGHWLNDPTAETFVANPFNELNCVMEVKPATPLAGGRH